MAKLTVNDTLQSAILKLAKGNPGAITVLSEMVQHKDVFELAGIDVKAAFIQFDKMNLSAPEIWDLGQYVCNERNPYEMGKILANLQYGALSAEDLKEQIQRREPFGFRDLKMMGQLEAEHEKDPNFGVPEEACILDHSVGFNDDQIVPGDIEINPHDTGKIPGNLFGFRGLTMMDQIKAEHEKDPNFGVSEAIGTTEGKTVLEKRGVEEFRSADGMSSLFYKTPSNQESFSEELITRIKSTINEQLTPEQIQERMEMRDYRELMIKCNLVKEESIIETLNEKAEDLKNSLDAAIARKESFTQNVFTSKVEYEKEVWVLNNYINDLQYQLGKILSLQRLALMKEIKRIQNISPDDRKWDESEKLEAYVKMVEKVEKYLITEYVKRSNKQPVTRKNETRFFEMEPSKESYLELEKFLKEDLKEDLYKLIKRKETLHMVPFVSKEEYEKVAKELDERIARQKNLLAITDREISFLSKTLGNDKTTETHLANVDKNPIENLNEKNHTFDNGPTTDNDGFDPADDD